MSQNGIVVFQERVPARMGWEEWVNRVHNIGLLKRRVAWYIGDLLLYGEETFGEKAWQEIEAMGYSEGALGNMKYVAKRFPPEERSAELPWSTYQAIAPFQKREREKLVTQALAGEINRAGIRALSAAASSESHLNGKVAKKGVSASTEAIGEALLAFGKLLGRYRDGEAVDALLKAAGDDLFEQWQILAEKLK
jgi:hypothetical protein